ncbi:MAG: HAMP domain-containing histidine kinase [Salinivirgaceae bacterium]|nr:HAMP domain-containing histidine kinase [Salinivirgaceae bacterium]
MLSDKELIEQLHAKLNELKSSQKLIERQQDELKLVNEKLAESEALKSHFISNITNEIINPFASILGLSKNIIAAKDSDIIKIKSMAELIHSEAFELDFQLKNIFTAAKIEAGEACPDYVKTDINLLLASIISAYKYKAEQKQLKINFSFELDKKLTETIYFSTDPEKLKLILSNLLSNSIKYSNAANKIEVKGWIDNNKLNVAVKDRGIGIDKKNLEIIFDRFKRLDSSINSINPGHGLGLSVTKALLDLLEGKIDIVSKRNLGSVFTISIPQVEGANTEDYAMDGNEFIFGDSDNEIF